MGTHADSILTASAETSLARKMSWRTNLESALADLDLAPIELASGLVYDA